MTNIINYYVALFSRGDKAAHVALLIAGLVVVLALLGMIKGFIRGIGRQGVRTVTVVVSAVLTGFATHSMLPLLVDFFEGKTMLEVFKMVRIDGLVENNPKLTDLLANMDAATVAEVATLPVAVFVLPVLFILLFVLISGFMLIVHACISSMLGYTKKNNNLFTRLLGGVLGLVQGVLVAAFILVPVSGLVDVCEEASARSEKEDSIVTTVYQTYFEEVSHSPIHEMVTKYGGEKLFKTITTVSIDKTHIDARESVYNILHIVEEWTMMEGENLSEMNESQREALNEIVDTMGDDPYITTAMAGIVRTMMKSEVVRTSVLEKFDEPFRGFFAEWIEVLKDSTKDTVHEDIDTIIDVIFIMADHGVLEAFMAHNADAMHDALITVDANGETAITLMVTRFNENDRTAHLVTTLARLSLTLMAGETDLSLTEETLTTFNNVKDGLTENVLSLDKSSYGDDTDAYINDVATGLDTTLTEQGIELDDEIIDGMAKYISDNDETISGLETMDDATVSNILIQYYASYIASTNP